jgi:uncharacterized protein (TIGR02996 family)
MAVDRLFPPRPELLALLDAVKDHPDDDTPRLVLADWLDEQDDPLDAERAAFIREHIAAARTGPPVFVLSDDERTARDERARRWLGPVAGLGTTNFDRGLPVLYADGPRLLRPDVPALLATEAFAFVQRVHLDQTGSPRMEALVALPAFRHVSGFVVAPFSAFGSRSAAKVFGSPNLTGLRVIDCYRVLPGADGAQALAKNPALARLRKLSLRHNKLVDKAACALAAAPHLTALQILNLEDNNIGDAGAEALAASPAFANLRELDLRTNHRLTDRSKQLLRDKFGDRAKLD